MEILPQLQDDEDNPLWEQVYSIQGHIHMKREQYHDALEWFAKAKASADEVLGENSRSSVQISLYMVTAYMQLGQPEKALEMAKRYEQLKKNVTQILKEQETKANSAEETASGPL